MIDSPIHEMLTDIRKKYSGKKVSITDIRTIEEQYHLCSIVNTRNDNCAFLRITSFGCDEVVFEDLVVNIDLFKSYQNIDDLLFALNKYLFQNAYGVILVEGNELLLDYPLFKPSYDFHTLKEENERLLNEREELLKKLETYENKGNQISLFDI